MKKIKKFAVAMVIGTAILGTSAPVLAAGCGNWYILSVGTPYCTPNLCCGPGLALRSYRQTVTYQRECVSSSNKISHPQDKKTKYLGCC